MIDWIHSLVGLQTPQQVGFLLCVLLAFALGWTVKGIREDRRVRRQREAFFHGITIEKKRCGRKHG